MNTGRLFWGMLLLTAGILLLLDRMGVFTLSWDAVFRLWPLVLVFWGVSLVLAGTRARWVAVALAAVTVAVIVGAVVQMVWHGSIWEPRAVTRQEFTEPMSATVERARLRFDSGAGRFVVIDTTAELLEASVRSSVGPYRLTRSGTDSLADVLITLEEGGAVSIGRVANTVEFRLHTAPEWDLSFDVGAAELRLDLTPFRVRELTVDCGASSVHLTLGDRAEHTRVLVDAGASSVRLRVPERSGCRVEMDAGLSAKRLREFTRVADGIYETENYADAPRRIDIVLDAGVSSIRVDRYRLGDRPW